MRPLLWRCIEWRLRRRLPPDALAPALGDLEEDYARRLASAGRLASAVWLWREADSLARAYRHRVPATEPRAGFDDTARDLRYALRTFRARPGAPLVIVLTFALGSAGVTTMFALINTVLLRPLPYPAANRLVAVRHHAPGLGLPDAGLSSGTYFFYRAYAQSFEELAVYSEHVANLNEPGQPTERIKATYAGPAFFRTLGAMPALGRLFTDDDARPGFMDLTWTVPVLLSHEFWERHFGGDRGVIEKVIQLDDSSRRIVGVLPAGFAFPNPDTQIWVLSDPPERTARFAASFRYDAIARLRPGTAPAAAEAELAAILPGIVGIYRDATPARIAEVRLTPVVVPLKARVVGSVGTLLWLLLGGTACLLLVACANTTTLSLLRAELRERESAIRTALGARPSDLVRLFAVDAMLLAAAGAALGLLAANLGLRVVAVIAPVRLPRLEELHVDAWVVGFTALLAALGAALLAAAALLTRAVRGSTSDRLKPTTAGFGRAGGLRMRDALVAGQIALALALLVGSALMAGSLWRLTRVDPGFRADHVLTVGMTLPGSKAEQHAQIYQRLVDHARALPGVVSASAASSLPLTGMREAYPFAIADRPAPTEVPVAIKFILPGYFQTMGTPVMEGRGFAEREPAGLPYEVVVSASFARRYFPDAHAIGKTIRRLQHDGSEVSMIDRVTNQPLVASWTVVGIVGDVREDSLRGDAVDMVYVPVRDPAVELSIVPTEMSLVMRASGPLAPLAAAARPMVHDVDASVSVADVRPLEELVAGSIASERFLASLLSGAALASLVLTAIGVYGVVAHAMRRREREIGIRVSLGARPAQVLRMVLGDSVLLMMIGTASGLAAAWAASRAFGSFLFGVGAADAITCGAAVAVVIVVAMVATLVPARRAVRADPVAAIRNP